MKQTTSRPRRKPARTPQLARVDEPGHSRLFHVLMATLVARVDRERRRVFRDLELSSIADTVGIAALEGALRDPEFRKAYGNMRAIVGLEPQRGSNALSIAHATGVPRETTRRKLKVLVERGFLVEKTPGRFVVKPGMLQKPEHLAAVERCAREAMIFMNQCLALGLVRVSTKAADTD